jgi:hypothetical protein
VLRPPWNPEEGADQGGRDLVADLFRRPAQRAHGDHHTQDGGDDSEPGQRVGDGRQSGHRNGVLVELDLDVQVH